MSDHDAALNTAIEHYSQGRILSDADAPEGKEERRVSDNLKREAHPETSQTSVTGVPPERKP